MMRLVIEGALVCVLHRLAGVHDRHPVGDPGDHAEIVGDQDDGGAELGLHSLESAARRAASASICAFSVNGGKAGSCVTETAVSGTCCAARAGFDLRKYLIEVCSLAIAHVENRLCLIRNDVVAIARAQHGHVDGDARFRTWGKAPCKALNWCSNSTAALRPSCGAMRHALRGPHENRNAARSLRHTVSASADLPAPVEDWNSTSCSRSRRFERINWVDPGEPRSSLSSKSKVMVAKF